MTKHRSRYAERLAARVKAGEVRTILPVDSHGLATLNPESFTYINVPGGRRELRTRVFTRKRRFDELEYV